MGVLLIPFWFAFAVAVTAVYWTASVWFEGNFGFLPTIGTGGFVHFSRSSIVATASISIIHMFAFLGFLFQKFLKSSTLATQIGYLIVCFALIVFFWLFKKQAL